MASMAFFPFSMPKRKPVTGNPEFDSETDVAERSNHSQIKITMPLFDYTCLECGKTAELLVSANSEPTCPSCQSKNLRKELSAFAAVGSDRPSTGAAAPAHPPSCGCCGPAGACGLN